MVAAGLIGAHLKAGRKGSWPDGGAQAHQGRNMQALYEILAVILLLILVYFSVMVALTIRGPFVMCM
ncbi:MAG: hypothetical protein A4E34_00611 [Methanoregula sp. PtaU1.Bin006]|nr:MAG: hypothetical protein A4E33_02446 [Methanoregula sp. PtaB.Bin085]OPY35611.1 MAG: hypothetical protein A4E34_00611 [Methanoregula sp. PtaU1.Bin006]